MALRDDDPAVERARYDELLYRDAPPEVATPDDEEISLQDPATIQADGEGGSVTTLPNGDTEFSFNFDDSEGSALGGGDEPMPFDGNLAELMTKSELALLADLIVQYKEIDLSSRKDWERMRASALTLLGVAEVDLTKLPFPGAARVYHPVLAEAVVQFQSNAIEEFFPATGPVKGALAGDANDENTAQVERAETFMNFYLTKMDKGYYADCDQELFTLPIDGGTMKKAFVDPVDNMPKSRFRRYDDFIAPYYCTDLQTSPRYIDRYKLTGEEIDMAIMRGTWLDVKLPESGDGGSGNELDARDMSDRRTRALHDKDRLYTILEAHLMRELPANVDELVEYDENGKPNFLPSYVVYVVEEERQIMCIKRLWDEDDPERQKEVWFSHKKFLPGLGFYGWGFPHVIGALAEAATGATRGLLDSALMATMQGGFRAKDGAKGGEAITIEPGKWKDIDATNEEIAKTFVTPPFKEPSPALFQMLEAIVRDARRFASITEVLTGTADNKAPVGTTLALIEQSMKLFTAIHKRIFNAAQEEFTQLAKLIGRHAPFDQYPYFLKGEGQVMLKSDFDARVDFMPVADPNIISGVQRISINQAVLELANSRPDLYGPEQMAVIHEEFLKALKVPYLDKIVPKPEKPTYVDAVTENAMLMVGKGVKAFPGQAHKMHIVLHTRDIMAAQASLPPDQFEPVYMNAMAHVREHMALDMIEQVSTQMQGSLGAPMPPVDIFSNEEDMDPKLEMAITMTASRLMPPAPPPPLPDATAGGEQAADPVAEAEAKSAALEAETQSRIERDTAQFTADQHQDQERHNQELRQQDEVHRQKLKFMSEESAAKIIRENAQAIAKGRQMAQEGAQRMAMEGRHSKMKSALEVEHGRSRIELQKEAAKAKPKPQGGKPK